MAEKLNSPNPDEEPQLQEPTREQSKEERQSNLSPERILEMSPKEMADLFFDLDSKGQLQSFLESSAENPSLVAQFSYWEKWLQKNQRRLVDETVAKKGEVYEGEEDRKSLPLHLEERFTSEELSQIFSSLGAIQLTFGCSKACPFCGFDAVPGVREHIPYSQLANLFQNYGGYLGKSKPFLYWASEPSDYASKDGLEDKTYQDVHQLAVEYARYKPHVTSRETNDPEWLKFMIAGDVEAGRVSVYGLDKEKIENVESITSKKLNLIGQGASHAKGIGVSAQDSSTSASKSEQGGNYGFGIGCFDGALLTPRGLYNVVQAKISEGLPQGQFVVPIEKISDQPIETGENLKRVLSRVVVVNKLLEEKRKNQKLNELLVSNLHGERSHLFFDEDGTINKVEDYISDLEKNITDLLSEYLSSGKEIGMYFDRGELREGQEEKIKTFVETLTFKDHPAPKKEDYYRKLNWETTNPELLSYVISINVPGIEYKKFYFGCDYNLTKKKIISAWVWADNIRSRSGYHPTHGYGKGDYKSFSDYEYEQDGWY